MNAQPTSPSAFFRTGGIPPLGHIRHHAGLPFSQWARIRPVRYWDGIPAFDPPQMRHAHDRLADMALMMANARRRKVNTEAEEREWALFDHLAHGWAFVAKRCDSGPENRPEFTGDALLAALDDSLRTIAAIAIREDELSGPLAEQAECVIALRWWAEPALRRLTPKLPTAKEGELA